MCGPPVNHKGTPITISIGHNISGKKERKEKRTEVDKPALKIWMSSGLSTAFTPIWLQCICCHVCMTIHKFVYTEGATTKKTQTTPKGSDCMRVRGAGRP